MHWTLKRIIGIGVWIVFIGSLIAYAYYQSRALREGPVITIISPENGLSVEEPLVRVSGSAAQAKELYLNGRAIFVDLEGRFDEELLLLPGYNIIELTAKDAGGNETRKTIELAWVGDPGIASTQPFGSTSEKEDHADVSR